ncbi:MAG: SCP2 sterol-binding domain-containing protein [Deltaproteobacteria bacterium]|jgi:putative sterol carrier protein|nr:SCP2 sterol-binding domain-containing protein [Deltaproteobacteria bacterium]
MNIDELYDYIKAKSESVRFDENLTAVINLHLNGPAGESLWRVSLAQGQAQVDQALELANAPPAEDSEAELESSVSVRLSEETLLDLVRGELSTAKAFLLRRVKVKGEMTLLAQLKKLLPAY